MIAGTPAMAVRAVGVTGAFRTDVSAIAVRPCGQSIACTNRQRGRGGVSAEVNPTASGFSPRKRTPKAWRSHS